MSAIPNQHEVEWAESDCASVRHGYARANNPWGMKIPPVMPRPAMDGQTLQWGRNTCGLWQYRRYLAINGKWVDLEPDKVDSHPFNCKLK